MFVCDGKKAKTERNETTTTTKSHKDEELKSKVKKNHMLNNKRAECISAPPMNGIERNQKKRNKSEHDWGRQT